MSEIIKELKKLKHGEINPNEEWLKKSRGVLLSQIKNTVTAESKTKFSLNKIWLAMSILLPRGFVYNVVRPMVVVLLVFSIGSSGWIATVAASQDSLPGEWLYSAKRVTEKTQVTAATVVGDKKTETNLRVEFAKRRAVETQKLVVSQEPKNIKKVSAVVSDFKQEIKQVNKNLEEINKETGANSTVSAEAVKNINKETEQIKSILKEVKTGLITASTSIQNNLADEVTQASGLAKDTAVKAVEVMVGKHLQGDNTVSKEEVKEAINNQVKSAQAESVVNKSDIDKAEKAVSAAVKKEDLDNKANTTTVKTTDGKLTKIEEVAKQVKEAVTKVQEVAQNVDKKAGETEKLLLKDDLAQAVKMAREVSDAAKTVENAAGDTMKALQIAMPAVAIKVVGGVLSPTSTITATNTVKSSTNTTKTATTTVRATTTVTEVKPVGVKKN